MMQCSPNLQFFYFDVFPYASENIWLNWLTSAPPETTYFNLIQFYFKSLRNECEEVEVENGTGTESQR